MEKTSHNLEDLLDDKFKVASLFVTPFVITESGLNKYYSIVNPTRTNYQDHKPEGMLFLAYMKHNPPEIPLDSLDTFFKYALRYYDNDSLKGLTGGLQELSSEDRGILSQYLFEKVAYLSKLAGQGPKIVTMEDQGVGHHLTHALNPFTMALWNRIDFS